MAKVNTSQLEVSVIAVLRRYPDCLSFHDATSGCDVSPLTLAHVVDAITKGKVNVYYSADGSTFSGVYRAGSNRLEIRRNYKSDVRRNSVIVHEAVHCVHDIFKRRITRPLNEVGTNVAENLFRRYLLRKNNKPLTPPTGTIDVAADKVAAWLEGLPRGQRIVKQGNAAVNKLIAALHADSHYGKKTGTTFEGDGVKKAS